MKKVQKILIMWNSRFLMLIFFFFCSGLTAQNRGDSTYLKAVALYQNGMYDEALATFKSNLSGEIPEYESNRYAGIIHLELNRLDEAIQYLELAEKAEKGKSAYYLAKAYARSGNLTKCLEYLDIHLRSGYKIAESQIHLDPDFERFENEKSWISFWNEGNYYSKFDRLLADADYAIKNDEYIEALDLVNGGIKNGYRKSVLLKKRAEIYHLLDNKDLAISDLNSAIDSDKRNPDLYEMRGDLNYELKKYKQALSDFEQAVKYSPEKFQLYIKRAKAYQQVGEFENALKDIRFFQNYYPDENESLYEISKIYMEEGRYLDALKLLNKCISSGKPSAKYYLARGESYFRARTYKNADRDLAMALDLNPADSDAWYFKALTNIRLGKKDHACFCLKKSFELGKKEAYDELLKSCPGYFK